MYPTRCICKSKTAAQIRTISKRNKLRLNHTRTKPTSPSLGVVCWIIQEIFNESYDLGYRQSGRCRRVSKWCASRSSCLKIAATGLAGGSPGPGYRVPEFVCESNAISPPFGMCVLGCSNQAQHGFVGVVGPHACKGWFFFWCAEWFWWYEAFRVLQKAGRENAKAAVTEKKEKHCTKPSSTWRCRCVCVRRHRQLYQRKGLICFGAEDVELSSVTMQFHRCSLGWGSLQSASRCHTHQPAGLTKPNDEAPADGWSVRH